VASSSETHSTAGSVFILWHVHRIVDEDDAKLIGVYLSKKDAEAAIGRLAVRPGFRETPDGFHVDEYEIGVDNWIEGYGQGKSK